MVLIGIRSFRSPWRACRCLPAGRASDLFVLALPLSVGAESVVVRRSWRAFRRDRHGHSGHVGAQPNDRQSPDRTAAFAGSVASVTVAACVAAFCCSVGHHPHASCSPDLRSNVAGSGTGRYQCLVVLCGRHDYAGADLWCGHRIPPRGLVELLFGFALWCWILLLPILIDAFDWQGALSGPRGRICPGCRRINSSGFRVESHHASGRQPDW